MKHRETVRQTHIQEWRESMPVPTYDLSVPLLYPKTLTLALTIVSIDWERRAECAFLSLADRTA